MSFKIGDKGCADPDLVPFGRTRGVTFWLGRLESGPLPGVAVIVVPLASFCGSLRPR